MTTLAQLHDCHGCNDERSFVQKKMTIGLSWLTVKVRVWVAKLHTDQTVGSSVMKARVVTVSESLARAIVEELTPDAGACGTQTR